MIIQIGNFKLIPNDVSPQNFDLIEMVKREKKSDKSEYDGENNLGYSMPLEHCLKIINAKTLSIIDKTVSFEEYLKEYTKQKTELVNVINKIITIQ